ncbi:MAG: hypothetical protein WD873_07505 [Candidatus Hydrogenedentales bacterium]
MHDLQQIDIKIPATKFEDIDAYTQMGVFQRWIHEQTIPGVLIDAADYSHIHHGPGVILVAHEFNVSLDHVGGRAGLLYHQKQLLQGELADRLQQIVHAALVCCRELETAPELQGRIAFDYGRIRVIANDRSRTENSAEDYDQLAELLTAVLTPLYGSEVSCSEVASDPRGRLAVDVDAALVPDRDALIEATASSPAY